MATIIFNGKTYNSLEEMPGDERQAFEHLSNMFVDKDENGIPDFLEGDMARNVMAAFTSTVNLNGQTYNGINELPPEVRAKVQGAFEKLAQLGLVSTNSPMSGQANRPQISQSPLGTSRPPISAQSSPTIQEDKGPNIMAWIVAAVAVVICLAAAAIIFLMK